jgi:hypothetical protein
MQGDDSPGCRPAATGPTQRGGWLPRGSEPGDTGYSLVTVDIERVAGLPATLRLFGAADRIRTGDVQLGKLAFCH